MFHDEGKDVALILQIDRIDRISSVVFVGSINDGKNLPNP